MVSETEFAALVEQAKKFKVIPGEWPTGKQCLRIAVAHVLRVPVERVPPRRYEQPVNEWLADVTLKFGAYLKIEPPENLPPADGQPWIAFVHSSDDADHAIPMVGRTVMRPEDRARFTDVVAEMFGGFRVVETFEECFTA
jgi:hypothetical protein